MINSARNLFAKQSATDTFKTASKTAIQTTAEAAGDLIYNKTPDKITKSWSHNNSQTFTNQQERYISPEKR